MKIRTIFLAMLVIAALVSTGSLTVFASSGVNQIEEVISESSSSELLGSASNNLKDMAIGLRDSLDTQIESKVEMVQSWAQAPFLIDAAKKANIYDEDGLKKKWDADLDNDISPDASYYLQDVVDTSLFTEIVVTDSRGYTIAASGATDEFDLSLENWYTITKAAPAGYYMGGTSQDEDSGSWLMDIVYTITDRNTGEYLGQVKAVFDYGTFVDSVVNTNSLLVWEIKVLEQNGNIVATSMIDKSKINNDEMNQADMAYFAGIANGGKTGYSDESEIDENGAEVYYGYAVSQSVDGQVIVVSKKAYAVAAPISAYVNGLQDNISNKSSDIQRNMWIMGCAVAVLIVTAAFFVIRAKVSNPLNKLTEVSNKLSVGEIEGLEFDVSGKDEIGRLGDAFQGVLAAFHLLKEQAEEKKETREPVVR